MRQLIFAIIIASLAIIFALQNADPVTISFFFWDFSNTSLALILVITLFIGLLAGMLFFTNTTLKRKKIISDQKKRILDLEKELSSFKKNF